MHLYQEEFSVLDLDFQLGVTLPDDVSAKIEARENPGPINDTSLVRIRVSLDDQEVHSSTTGHFVLSCKIPLTNIHGMITFPPLHGEMSSLPIHSMKKTTWPGEGFPYIDFLHRNGLNRFSFGLLDQITETEIDYEPSLLEGSIALSFSKPFILKNGDWKEFLYVSTSTIPWQDCLANYREFVDREWPQAVMKAPESAYDPAFSTQYTDPDQLHQNWVVENAFMASKLGIKTWVTGDGWYETLPGRENDPLPTPDWQPDQERFAEFAEHVQEVHKFGLKYLVKIPDLASEEASADVAQEGESTGSSVWFWKSKNEDQIIKRLESLVSDYQLDGLELDLHFAPCYKPGDADYDLAGEGVYDLMSRIAERLQSYNPDIMIKLNNRLSNLPGRRYGNLFSTQKVPANPALNRWHTTILRLLAPDQAVWVDPVFWGPEASSEEVAVTMINSICSVPVISIDLTHSQHSHINVLQSWLDFYAKHKETILHGNFDPQFHHATLPVIQFTGEKERIIALYEDYPLVLNVQDGQKLWVLNASSRSLIDVLPDTSEGIRMVTAHNKFGQAVYTRFFKFPLSNLELEPGGYLEISENRVIEDDKNQEETAQPGEQKPAKPAGKKRTGTRRSKRH